MRENIHYQIDSQLQDVVQSVQTVIGQEIDNLDPQFDASSGEFSGFTNWSIRSVKVNDLKITQVNLPNLG